MKTQANSQIYLEQVKLESKIGSHPILQPISAAIEKGDRIAVVGISGAGKTSLFRLLNRLTTPTQGAIYLEGKDYTQIPVMQLRQEIVLVLQEARLFEMNVRDAIAYPLQLRGFSASAIEQRVQEWIERLKIPSDWLKRTEIQLSAGQRQLVAIARALVIQPKILLLDEPTSALDLGRQSNLIQVLKQLPNTSTVLIATHKLDLAQQFCQRLWYLDQGILVQDIVADSVDWEVLRHQLVTAQQEEAAQWQENL